jgi:hypothetical protein
MATQVQLRRGNTSQTNAFTGAVAEITVDTDKETIVVHDGSTAGGFPLARESALSANSTFSQAAFNQANTANVTAEAGFAKANSSNVLAQAAFNKANTANVIADSAYAFANIANIKIDSAFSFANTVNIKTDAVFAFANTVNIKTDAAFAFSNTVNIKTDAAFTKANAANVLAQAAFNKANTDLANTGTSVTANGLTQYTFANTTVSTSNTTGALTVAGGVGIKGSIYADAIYDGGVEVISFANQAFNLANTANIKIDSGYAFANTVNIKVDAAFSFSNTVNIKTDAAFSKANTANITAEAAFSKSNSANVLAQSAFNKANSALANTGGSITGDVTITGNLTIVGQQIYANTQTVLIKDNIITLNAAIDQASAPSANAGLEIDRGSSANVYLLWNENSDVWQFTNDGTTYYTIADTTTLASAFNLANTANITAEAAFARANAANVLAQAAFNQANTANIKIDSAFAFANIANIKVDSAFAFSNTVNIKTDAAFVKANAANVLAQAAFDKANAALANTGTSVTANGLTIYTFANTTVSTSNTTGAVVISGGLGVKGSIYADAIYDSGIEVIAFANLAFNKANTANITAEAAYAFANTVNIKVDSAFAFSNTVNIKTDAAFVKANAANVLAQAAFDKANSVTQQGFVTVAANGTNVVADANNDTLTLSAANGIGITSNATTDTITINLTPTGVTSGTYANATHVPVFAVDAQGRLSSVTNTAILFPAEADTLQTVTTRGSTTANAINITNTTASTSKTTGALQVAGGVGVSGNVSTLGINVDNRVDWPASGTGAPTLTTKSAGTKVVLYPSISGSTTDYAIGIDAATMWYGVPEYGDSFKFKWYGATTEVASITGTGLFTTVSANITGTTASTSNTTGAITVAGGIGVKGNVSANGIIFDDGTRQTTAASAGGATIADVLALSIALG